MNVSTRCYVPLPLGRSSHGQTPPEAGREGLVAVRAMFKNMELLARSVSESHHIRSSLVHDRKQISSLPSRKGYARRLVQGASQRRQSVEREQMSRCHILARGDTHARLGAGKDKRGPSDQGRLVIRKTPCPARKIVSGVREHKIVDQRDQGRAVIRGSLPGAEKPCRARNR